MSSPPIATPSLLKDNSFPNNWPKWDGKIPVDQKLKYWQKFSLPLHQYFERKTRVATGRGNVFVTVASAVQTHGTNPSSMVATAGR